MEWISIKKELTKVDYDNKKGFIKVLVKVDGKTINSTYRHVFQDGKAFGLFYTYPEGKILNPTHWKRLTESNKPSQSEGNTN